MSTTIDNKIVSMQFDNRQFENNVKTSISTLDTLQDRLKFKDVGKGFDGITESSRRVNFSGLSDAVEGVKVKFSAMEVMAVTALMNITNSAVNAGKRIVSALTIDPVKTGFQEYETQINAVQTILANTESKGSTLEDVNNALDELNTYADKTIYNFTEMTRNIGTFTAAGVSLETSTKAIKGIANLAAVSGSTSQQASTAMYQLSQALSAGTVKLQDWNSVVNAGMGGQVFQDALKETARAHGIAIDQMIEDEGSFRDTLSKGWLSAEILTDTLEKFTLTTEGLTDAEIEQEKEMLRLKGYTDEQIESILKMGDTATNAATKVKTFTQLCDTLKEAAQSGWTQSWEIIIGDFEEAKALFTEISDTVGAMIGKSAEARNNMLQAWKDLGGRTDMLDGIRNIFESTLAIVDTISESFRLFFPRTTGKQLYAITKGFKDFTEALKPSEATLKKIKYTFDGVFSVMNITKNILGALIQGVIKGLAPLDGCLGDLGGSILDITSKLGLWLLHINNVIEHSDILQTVVQTTSEVISTAITKVIEYFNKAKDISSKAIDKVKDFMTSASTDFKFPGFDAFTRLLERINKRAFSAKTVIGETTKGIMAIVTPVFTFLLNSGKAVVKIIGDLGQALTKSIGSGSFNNFMDVINTGALTAFFASLASTVHKFSSIGETFENIADIIEGFGGVLEGFQNRLNAEALKTIAISIAILAGSLLVLSLIDSEKLGTAIIAISTLFGNLMVTMKMINGMGIDKSAGKGLQSSAKTMVAMAAAVLIMAIALKKVSDIDSDKLMPSIVALSVMTVVLTKCVESISKGGTKVMKGALGIVFFAAAIKILASACVTLSTIPFTSLVKGLLGVGALMTGVSLFLNNTKFSAKSLLASIGIINIAIAIKILASACADLAEIPFTSLTKSLIAIGVLLGELAAFTNLTGNAKKLVATGVSLILIAASMKIFASALSDFAAVPWEDTKKGLLAMGAIMAGLAATLNLMPKGMVKMGIGLLLISGAMFVLASAFSNLGTLSWESIGKGLAGFVGILGSLAIALNLMNGTIKGSLALLIAAGAMAIIAPTLILLSTISWEGLLKGLLGLAGAFAVLGIAGLVLGPILPAILGLAGALALVGISVLTVGAGVLALGVGLQALAVGLGLLVTSVAGGAAAIVAAIVAIVTGICAAVPTIIVIIGETLTGILNIIITDVPLIIDAAVALIMSLLEAVRTLLPEILNLLCELIVGILGLLVIYTPQIVDYAIQIIVAVVSGITANLPLIIETAINLIVAFIDGLTSMLGAIVQAAFDLVINFINGLADAIDKNTPLLVEAIRKLFRSVIRAGLTVLSGGIGLFLDAGKVLMENGLIKAIVNKAGAFATAVWDAVKGGVSKAGEAIGDWIDAGKNLVEGFNTGVKAKAAEVVESVKGFVNDAISAAKNLLGIHSPSRVFAEIGRYTDEGFAQGIDKYAGEVVDATRNVADTTVKTLAETMKDIDTETLNGLDSQPTIRPVIDLTDVKSGIGTIDNMFSRTKALSVSGMMNSGVDVQNGNSNSTNGNSIQFVQNNYSPKALSRIEIYRQTKNQISTLGRLGIV